MAQTPRPALRPARMIRAAARRLARRSPRVDGSLLRFGVRLGLALTLALAAAGAFAYTLVSHNLEQQRLRSDAAVHRADGRTLAKAAANARPTRRWLAEVTERLQALQDRPGTIEVILVDRSFRVVAAGKQQLVSRIDKSDRIANALRGGAAQLGHETDLNRDTQDFEFVQPVDLPGGRYAFEVTTDAEFLNSELSAIRHDLLLAGIVALLAAAGIFWLIGGRALLRSHGSALQRATRDGLTELSNHRAFQDELRRAGSLAGRYGEPLGLLMLDLDGFKFENDRYGHRHGDERLRTVAGVLRNGRAGDQAFRVGGDEFALLLPHTDADGARRAAERVRARLVTKGVRVSVGAGELRPGQTPADLREQVDAALYEAKRLGGDRVVPFDEIASRVSVMTTARSRALEELIAHGGIDVAFQPIWDLSGGALVGVEALARPHARYGFDGPLDAFDAAQQLGRLHELDVLCVTRILARADELPPDALLFINICPQTLDADADGNSWLADAVAAAGLDPQRVVIEVTERVGARTRLVVQTMRRLHDQGFLIAIDDVGAGNSGLEMLRQTHAEYIKLDRSVVVGALTDPNARGVLMAMAAFAHQTGAFVIAEGIEDEQVLQLVLELGTDASVATINGGQGYGLGRPDARMPRENRAPVRELLDTAPRDASQAPETRRLARAV